MVTEDSSRSLADDSSRPLAGYVVLDVTDQRGEVGPWLLAELGASVIKIEPPAGSPARHALPLAKAAPQDLPAASLQFCIYNANKRAIALDLRPNPADSGSADAAPATAASAAAASADAPASTADRQTFEALLKQADFIYSTEPDGLLSAAGYGYEELVALNPRIVHVQITPFGATGPRADTPYSELTLASLGGAANLQGIATRAPVKSSIPQVWRHAGAEAANAGLIAHARRLATNQPQHAVVSAQAAVTWTLLNAMEAHAICGEDYHRTGSLVMLAAPLQLRLEAEDGHVIAISRGALIGDVVEWLIDEGIVGTDWRDEDWETFDLRALSGEKVNHEFSELFEAMTELCSRYDKDTLMRKALTYRQTIAPINTVADLWELDHLRQRDFWSPTAPDSRLGEVELPGGALTIDGTRLGSGLSNGVLQGRSPQGRPPQGRSPQGRPPLRRPPLYRPPQVNEDGEQIRAQVAEAGLGEPRPEAPQLQAPPDKQALQDEYAYGTTELPLAGIKVADFSWIGVGPITAKALADHGASVVRIECSTRLDGLRVNPPFKDNEVDPDMSHFYGTFNTSKLSLDIDLRVPEGLEVAKQMIAWADVVIESWRPGTFAASGLSDEVITELNPSVILVHTSLLASGGTLSGIAGYGYHAAAIAGFYPVVGWPDLPPDGPYLAYTDTISPRIITASLLSALDRRRRTGQGCVIEAAQLECGLQFLAPELIDYQQSGYVATRNGNRDDDVAPQGVYPCAGDDRWCAITIANDEQWRTLVELLASPDWACDERLATLAGRQAAHDQIDEHLGRWSATFDPFELEQKLTCAGIPAGVVQRSSDLLADKQYEHLGFYRYLEHARMGTVPYAGHQYQIAGYESGPRTAAPTVGQHTFEVLTELLGMSEEQIGDIAAAGALG